MASEAANGWRETTMREAVTYFTSGDPFLKLEYSQSGVPVLAKGDVKVFGRLEHGEKRFIPETLVASRGYRTTEPGDYLLTTRDLTQDADFLGLVAPIPDNQRYLVNQGANVVRFHPDVYARYIVYWCNGPIYRSYIKGHHVGSTQIHIRKEDFFDAPLWLPPRDEQRAIAHILGTLDDKIELNRRMNETLEAMARALFKSWFVDFDPVRAKAEGRDPGLPQPLADLFPDSFEDSELGEIPRGWEVGALGDFLFQRMERCAASPETAARPYVPIDCISPKSLFLRESKPGEEAQSSLTKFYKGDILFGAMRPYFHKVCIAPFDGTTRTTAFVLYPRRPDDFAFAILQLRHPDTIDFATRHSTGSTIPYAVWTDSLDTMPVIASPLEVRKAFNHLVRPMLARIPEPYFENRTLTALRDTLLPKLISGELRVEDPARLLGGGD